MGIKRPRMTQRGLRAHERGWGSEEKEENHMMSLRSKAVQKGTLRRKRASPEGSLAQEKERVMTRGGQRECLA